jgi:hypothetical protein
MKGFLNWNIIFVCGYQDIAHSQEGSTNFAASIIN